MKIENRTALVTGANRGIGKALVESLLQIGARKIYAASRQIERLPDFGDDRVVPAKLDITNTDDVRTAAAGAGDVDLLINNAGVLAFTSLLDGPMDLLERDMNTNYYGTLDMVRNFVPVLESNKPSAIVNVVTIAAFANIPSIGGYSASKAAEFSMSQGIRIELAPRGIAVHTVNPGPIDTDMAKDFDMDKTSARDTAAAIIAGLEADIADIFPDPIGRQMFETWQGGYRDLENAIAEMHYAA